MVCNKTKIRIFGACALVLGLCFLQMSHNKHMEKQSRLSTLDTANVDSSLILHEEAEFEKRIEIYEYISGSLIIVFVLCFFCALFIKGKGRKR